MMLCRGFFCSNLLLQLMFLRGVVVFAFQPVPPPPSYLRVASFSSSSLTTTTTPPTTTTTTLWGFRSSLKRRLLSPFRRGKKESLQTLESTAISTNASYASHEFSTTTYETVHETTTTTTTTLQLEEQEESQEDPILSQYSPDNLYVLPDLDDNRDLTALEEEFRDMLAHFTQYSARDILSLRDARMRTLFQGIAASADEPLVYRAFEVLFEDLIPLRMGGRVIYRKLRKIMEESMREQELQVTQVVQVTGLEDQAVREARWSFLAVAMALNGDAYLTHEQLTATGLTDTAVDLLGFDSAEAFLDRIDKEHKDRLQFTEMMLGLHQCVEEVCAVEQCNAAQTVRAVVLDLVEHPPALPSTTNDAKLERLGDRYDEMVRSFRDWEGLLPPEADDAKLGKRQRRNMEIIRGCFQGAENVHVVDALRVLYTDYGPLRVAGDIIFGIVSSLMKKRAKAQKEAGVATTQ